MQPIILKLLLVGASSVGKSSLLIRFTDDTFTPTDDTAATIGVDFKVKMLERSGKRYKLNIWDTAGQERFRSLTSSYYRGAQGVIIVYDVTSRETFEALPTWFTELETFGTTNVVRLIVGNKTDKESVRQVSTEEGKEFADQRGCMFLEASAKKGSQVEEMFEILVDKILDTPSLFKPPTSKSANNSQSPPGGFPGVDLDGPGASGGSCAC